MQNEQIENPNNGGIFSTFLKVWVEWLSQHSAKFLSGIGSFLLLLVVGFYFFGRHQGSSLGDYIAIGESYNALISSSEPKKELIDKVVKSLEKHSELKKKFGGELAQKLLDWNQIQEALPFVEGSFQRTQGALPHYSRFAKTSLSIAKGEYVQALEQAKKLKMDLLDDALFFERKEKMSNYGSVLYLFNLLRIAMLEKEAGTPSGEAAAWTDLLAQNNAKDPEAWKLLQANFQQDDLSLVDYINYRKSAIGSAK